jgi:hypothetical protein
MHGSDLAAKTECFLLLSLSNLQERVMNSLNVVAQVPLADHGRIVSGAGLNECPQKRGVLIGKSCAKVFVNFFDCTFQVKRDGVDGLAFNFFEGWDSLHFSWHLGAPLVDGKVESPHRTAKRSTRPSTVSTMGASEWKPTKSPSATQSYTGLFTDGFAATMDALDRAPAGSRISAMCLGNAIWKRASNRFYCQSA